MFYGVKISDKTLTLFQQKRVSLHLLFKNTTTY